MTHKELQTPLSEIEMAETQRLANAIGNPLQDNVRRALFEISTLRDRLDYEAEQMIYMSSC